MKCDQFELMSEEDELPCSSKKKRISVPKFESHFLSGYFGYDSKVSRQFYLSHKSRSTDFDRSQDFRLRNQSGCQLQTQFDELHEWCQRKLSGLFSPRKDVLIFSHFNPKQQTIHVRNNFKHLNTKNVVFRSCVLKDGLMIRGSENEFKIYTDVGEMQEISLNIPSFYELDAMYHLNFYIEDPYTQEPVLCHQQRLHHLVKQEVLMYESYGHLDVIEDESFCDIAGESFSVRFNKQSGLIESYVFEGRGLLSHPMGLLCNRGPMNYEDDRLWYQFTEGWHQRAVNTTTLHFSIVVVNDSRVRVTVRSALGNGSVAHTIYKVFADGRIWVRQSFIPSKTTGLSMIGFEIPMLPEVEEFLYFGRGPYSNYQNLNDDLPLGVYKESIMATSSPKTFENHTNTFWASLTNKNHCGLMVKSDKVPLNVGAQRRQDGGVDLIVAMNVVGWLSKHEPQFLEVNRDYHYEFELVPITQNKEDSLYKIKII